MFGQPVVKYTYKTAGIFIGLVTLQQVWGVDFNTAVQRADKVTKDWILRFYGKNKPFSTEELVSVMRSLAPPS